MSLRPPKVLPNDLRVEISREPKENEPGAPKGITFCLPCLSHSLIRNKLSSKQLLDNTLRLEDIQRRSAIKSSKKNLAQDRNSRSLMPPRACPIDFLHEFSRKSTRIMNLRHPRAFPSDRLYEPIGNQLRMSLRPPRAFCIDAPTKSLGERRRMSLRLAMRFEIELLNEIYRNQRRMSLRPPSAFPMDFFL